jgi:hypothetical protein
VGGWWGWGVLRSSWPGHRFPLLAHRRLDLATNPDQLACPYLSLYDGFERRWAFYKVLVSCFKLLLVVLVVVLWRNVVVQSALCLAVLAGFGGFALYSRPFLSPVSDVMDATGRITAFATLLLGLIGSPAVAPGAAPPLGTTVTALNAVQAAVMVVGTLWGINRVRLAISAAFGQIQVGGGRGEGRQWGGVVPAVRLDRERYGRWRCARSSPTRRCTRRAASARSLPRGCGTCARR